MADVGQGNRLLAALRPADREAIERRLTPMDFKRGDVLHHAGDVVRYAWFPCDRALASFVVTGEDGTTIETALVGREGAIGGIVSHGRLPAYADARVQYEGVFLRIEAAALEEIKGQSPAIANLFARYSDCLLAQVFQAVACNAAHNITQRTAKWLLSAMDRTGDHVIPLRQEQLAELLGVGRSFVNRVLKGLRETGVLTTRRGYLEIRDFAALSGLACACNDRLREHFDTVLEGVYPDVSDLLPAEDVAAATASR
ncbi:MAG: Crp/Fnr family transcriptional regulator [Pseudomonadota bacterium]